MLVGISVCCRTTFFGVVVFVRVVPRCACSSLFSLPNLDVVVKELSIRSVRHGASTSIFSPREISCEFLYISRSVPNLKGKGYLSNCDFESHVFIDERAALTQMHILSISS